MLSSDDTERAKRYFSGDMFQPDNTNRFMPVIFAAWELNRGRDVKQSENPVVGYFENSASLAVRRWKWNVQSVS